MRTVNKRDMTNLLEMPETRQPWRGTCPRLGGEADLNQAALGSAAVSRGGW